MSKPMPTVPPWHLWGNIQRQRTLVETTGAFRVGNQQQLCKVGYGRPETWRFYFSAKLIRGPDNTPGFFTRIFVEFFVTIGEGRGSTPMQIQLTSFTTFSFEQYIFQWGPATPAFPAGAMIWTTQAQSPNRGFNGDGPVLRDGPLIDQLPAESIQVECRIVAITIPANVAAVGQEVEVEVSSYWAPNVHVRPDWYEDPQPVFAGGETEGR